MLNFLREKWYWVLGGLIGLYLAYKLFSQSSSASAPAGTNPYAAYSSPGVIMSTQATDAQLQIAQIQANSGLAAAQIASAQAVSQAQIALEATKDTNKTDLSKTRVQAANALAITNSNNATAMHISDNGSLVAIRQSGDARDLGIVQSNNALAGLQDTNASKLAAYGIQAQIASQQIDATRQIAQTQISADRDTQIATLGTLDKINQDQIAASEYQTNVARDLLNRGVINLNHGTTITEQSNLNALLAVLNPSGTPAVASAGASQAYANAMGAAATTPNWASITASLAKTFTGGLSTLFG